VLKVRGLLLQLQIQEVTQVGCDYENLSSADPCTPGRDWGNQIDVNQEYYFL
jgi:hypothetical protein